MVKTTLKTYDPAAILKARDLIKLLARSVPAAQAIKILQDGIACDIIKIRNLISGKEQFVKRRQRILGPGGNTIKALQLLTNTYILVHGSTVCVMGPYKGLTEIRRIVEDCLHNIHPIYRVKQLMVMRELEKDPELAKESWEPYLPKFQKSVQSRRRKPHKITDKSKKTYTPFPPPLQKSKVDLQIESGEYFLGKMAKQKAARQGRMEKQKEKQAEREKMRTQALTAPEEPDVGAEESKKKKKRKKQGESKDGQRKKKRTERED